MEETSMLGLFIEWFDFSLFFISRNKEIKLKYEIHVIIRKKVPTFEINILHVKNN